MAESLFAAANESESAILILTDNAEFSVSFKKYTDTWGKKIKNKVKKRPVKGSQARLYPRPKKEKSYKRFPKRIQQPRMPEIKFQTRRPVK